MKKTSIVRINSSPYFAQDFIQQEKNLIESIPNCSYHFGYVEAPEDQVVLITNTHTKISLISNDILAKTKLILHANSGYDNLITEYSLIKNIPTIIGHEIRSEAVSLYITSALLYLVQKIPVVTNWDGDRKWDRKLPSELKVAIFGMGHVGKRTAEILKALHYELYLVDPFKNGYLPSWKEIPLKDIDVVISCVSQNNSSINLFNEDFFREAKSNLILINPSRGKVIDETALLNFLKQNGEATAILDVFCDEPFSNIWEKHPQVLKTSHIAGVFKNIDQATLQFEYKILKDLFNLSLDIFLEKYLEQNIHHRWHQGMII